MEANMRYKGAFFAGALKVLSGSSAIEAAEIQFDSNYDGANHQNGCLKTQQSHKDLAGDSRKATSSLKKRKSCCCTRNA